MPKVAVVEFKHLCRTESMFSEGGANEGGKETLEEEEDSTDMTVDKGQKCVERKEGRVKQIKKRGS